MKRGQISIFIILGIIITILIVTIVIFRNSIFKNEFEVQSEKSLQVPEQIKPIKSYIDSCVELTSKEAIDILGSQGGYINIPIDRVPRGPFNQFSNSLEVVPNSLVAYWFYETSNNIQKTQIPSLQFMENEISRYVNLNLDECLKELFSSEEYTKYSINFQGSPETQTSINTNYVEVTVNYPVNIYLNEIGKLIETHYVKLDIPLGELYETSNEILNKEYNENFFSKKTIDMLSVYEEVPYSGISLDCNTPTWSKSQVIKNLKNIVSLNIGATKLKGSQYTLSDESHKYFELETSTNNNQINSFFLYSQNWPLSIEIYPSENEILSADQITRATGNKATEVLSKILCLNTYNFIYDIKYPILISLEKDNYIFQYGLQVIIDNNQPKTNELGDLDLDEVPFDICSRKVTPITVNVLGKNGNQLKPIEAEVSYQCFATSCYIGKTQLDEFNDYKLTALFPECLNGQVIAENKDYFTTKEIIDSNEETSVSVVMKQYYNFNYDIKVIEKSSGYIRDLAEDEDVMFEFKNLDEDYTLYLSKDENDLKLIEGNYQIKSYLSKKSETKFKIDQQEISKCIKIPRAGILGLFLKTEKCATSTIEATELDDVIVGGIETEIKIDPLKSNKDKVSLYTVFDKIPTSYDDLSEIEKNIGSNSQIPSYKKPEFQNE
ncbi:hypothetical protein J4455_02190 [Candidatus Woesearchaeota archaeon]|nr:hypothetical protein [Candidatus Woesearchaeota archaeon]